MSGSTAAGALTRCSNVRHGDMTTSTSWSNLPTLIALSNCSAASDIHRLPAPHERASSWSTCEGAKSTHPVTFDAEGGGVYQMDDGNEWVYPSVGFNGMGSVNERPVRCLSPEVQVLVHAGYDLTQKDYRELYLLRERFGVEPPTALLEDVMAASEEEDEV